MLGAVALPNIPTGKSLVVKQDMLPTQTGSAVTPMSPGQSAVAMFADMRDSLETIVLNTGKTVSLLSKLVIGEKTDDRREAIGRAETDEDIPPPEETDDDSGGPGFLSKLNKLNPFSSESGALVKFIAAGLALIGLNIFKDKLIPKLSALLNFFFGDDENSFDRAIDAIGLKVREITDKIKEKVLPIWEDIKTETEVFVEKVKEVYNLVASIVKGIGSYLLSFDTGGAGPNAMYPDGKLDENELKAVTKDITDRLTKGIFGFLDGIVGTILSGITLYAIGTTALKLLMTRGAVAAGAGAFLAGGFFSMAAAAVVIGAGIFKLGDNIMTAYNAAVTDELGRDQSFSMKKFVSKLLTGKETGDLLGDTLKNAADKAIIGGSLGFVIGGPLGAAIGALAGGIVGGFATYVGSEETEKFIESAFGENSIVGMTVNYLVDVYKKLILDPFEFLFGKLGEENDSLLARLGYQFDGDKSETFLGMGMADQEKYYGKNSNPENLMHLSTDELLSMQSDLIGQKQNLPKSNPILGMTFGDGYMDTNRKRTVFKSLDAVESVLSDRGITSAAPANISTGPIIKSNGVPLQSLKDIQDRKNLEEQLSTMIANSGNKINSDNHLRQQNFIGSDMTAGHPDGETRTLVDARGVPIDSGAI